MDRAAPFGEWVKSRRQALGKTRDDLAECAACSRDTIEKIELGRRRPSKQIAHLLAGCLVIPEDARETFIGFARGQVNDQGATLALRAALYSRASNLPATLTSLVGRERELAAARHLLLGSKGQLVTLVGPGGVGKTRLALSVADELSERFPDGAHFVALAPIRDPELMAPVIARAVGLKDSADRPPLEALTHFLRSKRALLLFDNFEQVRPGAPMLADLLSHCPGVKALVTSREALRVKGEKLLEVLPLEVPGKPGTQHSVLSPQSSVLSPRFPAVQLFIERASATGGFTPTEENLVAVAEICSRLDGLPLAIELAAARSRMLSPPDILARLDRRFALLNAGPRDAPDRHRALHNTFEWSYDLLDPGEQRLFARLGVFVGGVSMEAAEAVCNPGESLTGTGIVQPLGKSVSDGVKSLLDKSLLREEGAQSDRPRSSAPSPGERRFTMLETVREYALEMLILKESGEAEATRHAHAEFYLALAEKAEPELRGPQQGVWMETLDREHDNLRAALAWTTDEVRGAAEETPHSDMAVRLASALGRFWHMRGYVTEGRRWLEAALAPVDIEQADLLGPWHLNALNLAGVMAAVQGDYERASFDTQKSLKLARMLGDKSNMARSLNNLGIIARRQGDYTLAEEYLTDCLQLHRELGDKVWTAGVLGNLGVVEHIRGKYEEARRLSAESMALRRELGDKSGLANTLGNVASMYREHGEFEQARGLLDEALALSQERANKQRQIHVLAEMGQLMCDQGDYEQAEPLLRESLELSQTTGEKSHVGGVLTLLGRIALHKKEHALARSLFREALTNHRQVHEYGSEMADLLEWMALLEADQATSEGNLEGYRQATLLLGATDERRKEMDAPLPPIKQEGHAQAVEVLRAQLGKSMFDKAWAEGQAMSLDAAVALALE